MADDIDRADGVLLELHSCIGRREWRVGNLKKFQSSRGALSQNYNTDDGWEFGLRVEFYSDKGRTAPVWFDIVFGRKTPEMYWCVWKWKRTTISPIMMTMSAISNTNLEIGGDRCGARLGTLNAPY